MPPSLILRILEVDIVAGLCSKHFSLSSHLPAFEDELSACGEKQGPYKGTLWSNVPVSRVDFSVPHVARVRFCGCVKRDIAQSSSAEVTVTVTPPHQVDSLARWQKYVGSWNSPVSSSTQKLPPIFPCCLSSTICNRPFVPFYFIGSRAANYH